MIILYSVIWKKKNLTLKKGNTFPYLINDIYRADSEIFLIYFTFKFLCFQIFYSLCIFRFTLDFESQIFILVSKHLDPTKTLQVDKCQYCMFIVIHLCKLREYSERKTDK